MHYMCKDSKLNTVRKKSIGSSLVPKMSFYKSDNVCNVLQGSFTVVQMVEYKIII